MPFLDNLLQLTSGQTSFLAVIIAIIGAVSSIMIKNYVGKNRNNMIMFVGDVAQIKKDVYILPSYKSFCWKLRALFCSFSKPVLFDGFNYNMLKHVDFLLVVDKSGFKKTIDSLTLSKAAYFSTHFSCKTKVLDDVSELESYFD